MAPLKRLRETIIEGRVTIDLVDDDDEAPAPKRPRSIPPTTPLQLIARQNSNREYLVTTVRAANEVPTQNYFTHRSPNKPLAENVLPSSGTRPDKKQSSNRENPILLEDVAEKIPSKAHQKDNTSPRHDSGSRPKTSLMSAFQPVPPLESEIKATHNGPAPGFKLPPVNPIKFNPSPNHQTPLSTPSHRDKKIEEVSLPDTRPAVASQAEVSSGRSVMIQDATKSTPEVQSTPSASKSSASTTEPQAISAVASQSNVVSKTSLFNRQSESSQQKKVKLVINLPRLPSAERRRWTVDKLQDSTMLVQKHPQEIDRTIGKTGFSTCFLPQDQSEKLKSLAQPKKRTVNRDRITLDLPNAIAVKKDKQRSHDFVHPQDQVRLVYRNRFSEITSPPITFSNDINDHHLHGKFQFVNRNKIHRDVKSKLTQDKKKVGCKTTCSSGQCGISCSCMDIDRDNKDGSYNANMSRGLTYRRRKDGLVVLSEERMNEDVKAEIVECNETCCCSNDCINRVVRRGRTLPLEIFETGRYGFGVRSSQNIVRGQFIEVYLGEVIDEAELTRREEIRHGHISYVYSLDWFRQDRIYHIDGRNFGSATRFVNHSCDPNARVFPVMNNTSTREIYDLAFFAIKDIPAGTEITIDYNPQLRSDASAERDEDESEYGSEDEESDDDSESDLDLDPAHRAAKDKTEKCLCGSANCRKTPWNTNVKSSKRRKQLKYLH